MRVAIGFDRAGSKLKEALKPYLRDLKYDAVAEPLSKYREKTCHDRQPSYCLPGQAR